MRVIIEVEKLRKEFNGIVAVDSISFSVERGEIFGFLGPNGAGKTTTINMLTTLIRPTSGTARIAGYDIVQQPEQVRRRIGLVPQEVVLEGDLTARENLVFHGMLYGLSRQQVESRIPELLAIVELEERADSKVKTFSGGMKRRLELVKVLIHEPEVIFLDEPTVGLDPQTRRRIWEYIRTLNTEKGVTVFLTTHYMEEAEQLCDRVCIIDHGRILDIDPPERLKHKVGEGEIVEIELTARCEEFVKELEEAGLRVKSARGCRVSVVAERSEKVLAEVFSLAQKLGTSISSISVREPTLEDVFIHYTGRSIRDEQGGDTRIKQIARRLKH
ncbi:MAG: ATP-binding cassette domain-containing protein [Euryarchaeota archaeon]|nr:ATP-binding cassette domain-containing protein [Euryarchaeota archaeon]